MNVPAGSNRNDGIHARGTGINRRAFLGGLAAAAGAVAMGAGGCSTLSVRKARIRGPADKLNIAFVGAAGRAHGNIEAILPLGQNIVALCDVAGDRLDGGAKQVAKEYPNVKRYSDYRKLLETEKNLDAVVVSTPDHMHAPVTMLALDMGLHVYCEKPLTRTVWEARRVRDLTNRHGAMTQMGNQGSGGDMLRRTIEIIRSGVTGPVREVHVWTDRPIWPQGVERPAGSDPVPPNLDWNTWLGVAPERPFKSDVYHPFKWRGWFDFGTGAIGDIACHACNIPFHGLYLEDPTEIEAEVSDRMPETFPKSSRVRWLFPARAGREAVTLYWYDGGRLPEGAIREDIVRNREKMPDNGCYILGDKGVIFDSYMRMKDEPKMMGFDNHEAGKAVPKTYARIGGAHHKEWIDAIKGGPKPFSNFDAASRLTEWALLGAIAQRVEGKLSWDAGRMKFANNPKADALLRPTYRPGWTI